MMVPMFSIIIMSPASLPVSRSAGPFVEEDPPAKKTSFNLGMAFSVKARFPEGIIFTILKTF